MLFSHSSIPCIFAVVGSGSFFSIWEASDLTPLWSSMVLESSTHGSHFLTNSFTHSSHFLTNLLQNLRPFPGRLKRKQWSWIPVQVIQHHHRNQRGSKHRYRTKNPHQQRGGKVQGAHADGPEITRGHHCLLNASNWDIRVWHGYEENRMDVTPSTLHKRRKSHYKADEQAYVFDGNDWLACVSVDELACEGGFRRASDPCPDQRAKN